MKIYSALIAKRFKSLQDICKEHELELDEEFAFSLLTLSDLTSGDIIDRIQYLNTIEGPVKEVIRNQIMLDSAGLVVGLVIILKVRGSFFRGVNGISQEVGSVLGTSDDTITIHTGCAREFKRDDIFQIISVDEPHNMSVIHRAAVSSDLAQKYYENGANGDTN